MGLVRGLL